MKLHGTQMSLEHLHPFGCKAIVYEPSARRRTRFHPRGRDCVYVGHESPHSVVLIAQSTGVEEIAHHTNINFYDEEFPSLRDHDKLARSAFHHYERRQESERLLGEEREVFGDVETTFRSLSSTKINSNKLQICVLKAHLESERMGS